MSPLEHESCREVIESLTSENAKLKEDIDTLQREREKLGLSRTPLSKVLQFRKEIKNLKKLNKVLNKRIQQKNTILRSIRLRSKRQMEKITKLTDEKRLLEESNQDLRERLSRKDTEICTLSQDLETSRTEMNDVCEERDWLAEITGRVKDNVSFFDEQEKKYSVELFFTSVTCELTGLFSSN